MRTKEENATAWELDHIACPLLAREAGGVIRELAARLSVSASVKSPASLLEALEAREARSHTYLGGGIAMPHARTHAVDRVVIAVGLSRAGIAWGSDRESARLVFLVGVPRDGDTRYMDIVRRITGSVRRLDWIERATACRDSEALHALLTETIPL